MQSPRDTLSAPERLAALRHTALLDTPTEQSFDRLARFAARLLDAPVALISLVDEDRQFFKSQCGLPEPWASERQIPLSHSFCQHVVASAEPLVVESARQYALVKDNLAIPDLGVEAYLGVPIRSADGQVLGSFCVIDHEPRRWTAEELEVLHEVAASAMAEIDLRTAQAELAQRVEEKTEESRYWERYFRALVDASPNAVFAKDADGRFTLVNPQMAELYGARPEDLIGKTDSDLNLSEEQVKRFEEADRRVLRTGESVHIPAHPLPRAEGADPRWFEARKVALTTPAGRREVLGVATDVTALKEAESALRRSDRWFRALIEHGRDLIAVLDSGGVYLYASPSVQRILGHRPDELLGRSAFELIHADDLPRVLEAFEGSTGSPGEIQSVQYRFRHTDGSWRWLEGMGTSALEDPAIQGVVVSSRDITERRRAEAQIAQSERRFRALVENVSDAVTVLDRTGGIQYVSPALERITGYSPAERAGRSAFEHVHPEDLEAVRAEFRRLAAEPGARAEVQPRLHHKDGRWRTVRLIGHNLLDDPAVDGIVVTYSDITERLKAGEALRESKQYLVREQIAREHAEAAQERITDILESITDGFLAVDEHWCFTYANREVERIAGIAREDLLGRNLWEALSIPEESRFRTDYQRAVREQVPVEFEEQDPLRGLWLRARAYPYEDGLAVYLRDITRRKEAMKTATLEQRRLRAVLDSLPVGVFLTDEAGRITRANPAAEQLWGTDPLSHSLSPEEYDRYEGWWPGSGERLKASEWALARAVMGESVDAQEVEIATFDGARRTIVAYARPILNGDGKQLGAVAAILDITERKEAEDVVRRREAQLAQAQKLADLGSWEWDLQEKRVIWSDNLYRICGLRPEEFPATIEGYLERVHSDDSEHVRATIENCVEAGALRLEYRFLRGDGEVRYQTARGQVLRDRQDQPVRMIGTVQDITERKQAEEALRAAKEEAEAASRAKSEMLSRTSHELRTPMNAILGFAQLLEVEGKENQESVEQILRAGRHLLGLINEVLDIAEAESCRMALSSEPVYLPDVLEEVLFMMDPLARQNRIELRWHEAPPVEVRVLTDPKRLKQVLLNLVSNGIKYNRPDGRVDMAFDRTEGDRVRIEVRDTGFGIEPERLSRLFSPFERAGAEQTQTEGTGLGLALSKAVVKAMGGEIGARSTPGEGSTFWIEVPCIPAGGGPQKKTSEGAGTPSAAHEGVANTAVVLYVEDAPANVRLVERILRRSRPDVELITAPAGLPGLELARERHPDLILLDLNLPDISGEEVLLSLQEEESTREIPVVMISGDVLPAQIERLRSLGAVEYLTKPFDVPHFLKVLGERLEVTEM